LLVGVECAGRPAMTFIIHHPPPIIFSSFLLCRDVDRQLIIQHERLSLSQSTRRSHQLRLKCYRSQIVTDVSDFTLACCQIFILISNRSVIMKKCHPCYLLFRM